MTTSSVIRFIVHTFPVGTKKSHAIGDSRGTSLLLYVWEEGVSMGEITTCIFARFVNYAKLLLARHFPLVDLFC